LGVAFRQALSAAWGRAAWPALTLAILASAPAWALRNDWTDAEVACAKSVGVDLRADPDPGSSGYVKRLAWLADLVVYANVTKVRREEVRIKVLSAKKGRPPSGRLTVALMPGSPQAPSVERILEGRFDTPPSFVEGETVLLFLTRSDAAKAFLLVDDSKFHIDDDSATLQGWGNGEYNVVRSNYQIRQVVEAQAASCE
jgi:hypothetical protein